MAHRLHRCRPPRRTAAAAALLALTAALAGAAPAGAVLDQSDWRRGERICVNKTSRSWQTGRPYRANSPDKANCRVLPAVGADTRERRFVVSVPQSALDRRRIPVVFFLHGTSGTGERYWNISRWRELAHRRGFVAVFPSSLRYDLKDEGPTTVWNSIGQACDLKDPTAAADDVAFIRAIYDDLDRRLRLDRRRVYAAGFSNGGQMVHRLAAEAGDIFASAASWAGVPAEGDGPQQCAHDNYAASPNPIPVWNGMGSKDDRFMPVIGGRPRELPLRPRLIERSLRQTFDDAALLYSVVPSRSGELSMRRLVCQPPYRRGSAPVWSPVLVFDAVQGNAAGNQYLFVILDELEHHYPNAWPPGAPHRKSRNVTMALLQYQWFLDNPKGKRPPSRGRGCPR